MRILFALCLVFLAALPARAAVDIQELRSPDGQRFWLVQEMAIPIVAVEVRFQAGSWTDPEGKEGVARFAFSLMDQGAGDLDAVAFANRRSDLAARFSFWTGRDGAGLSARFLVETLDDSVDLMVLALTEPRFDPDPIERTRRRILASIAQSKTSPSAIASRTWGERAFPGHPYGRPSLGTEDSVAAIARDDLLAAHRRLVTRTGVDVVIVGAITPEEAGALVDRVLAELPESDVLEVPMATTTAPPGVHVIVEEVPQSTAVFGHAGLFRDDPDYIPAFVMNHILGGGGFSSRLLREVREERGLAYGVSSRLQPSDGTALIVGSVQTENARVAESLAVIRDEWARMAAGEVTQEELDQAKTFLTGSFPLSFDTNGKIASVLARLMTDGFDAGYVNRRNDLIEAVTLDDIRKAAARLLDPAALSIVVVGQPDGL